MQSTYANLTQNGLGGYRVVNSEYVPPGQVYVFDQTFFVNSDNDELIRKLQYRKMVNEMFWKLDSKMMESIGEKRDHYSWMVDFLWKPSQRFARKRDTQS